VTILQSAVRNMLTFSFLEFTLLDISYACTVAINFLVAKLQASFHIQNMMLK